MTDHDSGEELFPARTGFWMRLFRVRDPDIEARGIVAFAIRSALFGLIVGALILHFAVYRDYSTAHGSVAKAARSRWVAADSATAAADVVEKAIPAPLLDPALPDHGRAALPLIAADIDRRRSEAEERSTARASTPVERILRRVDEKDLRVLDEGHGWILVEAPLDRPEAAEKSDAEAEREDIDVENRVAQLRFVRRTSEWQLDRVRAVKKDRARS
jgi:hypothetical protein